MKARRLRTLITRSLRRQGFLIRSGQVALPPDLTKDKVRSLHAEAVRHRIDMSRARLRQRETALLAQLASGAEVVPERITPRLIEVKRGSFEELLFRYSCLHWSIPLSSGYGRRLRFLVMDDYTGKLLGLIGLGDPVFSLGPRDEWIGWTRNARRRRLQNVLDAFVLGAVPPYSFLLGGKLVAMLAASNEVRAAFRRKYGGRRSLIRGATTDGRLAMITTSSALGPSSIYNRLQYNSTLLYQRVGFTSGSGDFHFSNGLYSTLSAFAHRNCTPTAKRAQWGSGFRNRREVIKKCLSAVGLSSEWIYHGVQRELFVIPLAKNTRPFLQGRQSRLFWLNYSQEDLFTFFRSRWLMPRSERDRRFRDWHPVEWRLWP